MFALDRVRDGTEDCPEETVRLAGSTGNVYTVTIAKVPTCDCTFSRSFSFFDLSLNPLQVPAQ